MNKVNDSNWLFEISSKRSLFDLKAKEIWQYRDLLFLFVKRDIVTVYKQTILGPLWYLIQPLMMSVIFTIIFNRVAGIETNGINAFLFNLAGITVWNYFAACITESSDTFKKNQAIFGKVYFPRAIMPISVIVSNLVKFGIQLFIFTCVYLYFVFKGEAGNFSWQLVLLPIFVLIMGFTGLGLGMIISSLTTKYRDLIFLVQFGVQLLMYLSAVMYPIALAQKQLGAELSLVVSYNPLAVVIDNLRLVLFYNGNGFELAALIYPMVFTVVIFVIGLVIFNKTERDFIDTI